MSNVLEEWAFENKIPKKCIDNLRERFGVVLSRFHYTDEAGSESSLQNRIRLEEAKRGVRLFRNNSGVATDRHGRPVRYGLANDSSALNREVKSSDLIGIDGEGKFVSLEVKRPGWVFRGTEREIAQLNWIVFVNCMGGRARFVSSLADYEQEDS